MTELDTFETALLAELRREVAEHPAAPPAAPTALARPTRRRLTVAAAAAVTTAAATVAAVGLTAGGPAAAPAFAVDGNPDGSVDVAVFRLDDRDGLESALAEHGIDAEVHFTPAPEGGVPESSVPGSSYLRPDAPGYGSCGIGAGPGPAMLVPTWALEETDTMPSGPEFEGAEYVLQIRADSPLFGRAVVLDVGGPGSFSIAYASGVAGKYCFYGQGPLQPVDGPRAAGRS